MKKLKIYLILVSLIYANVCFSQSGWFLQSESGGFDIDFINSYTGYKTDGHFISKTTDGRNSWINQYMITNTTLRSIDIYDSLNIAAVGVFGIIIRTSDSGNSWVKDSLARASDLFRVLILTKDVVFVFGHSNSGEGLVVKSTNGGLNWTEQVYPHGIGSEFFLGATFINEFTGYIIDYVLWWPVTRYSRILKTTNGGLSWFELYQFNTKALNNIYFINTNTGYVCGDKALFFTSDAGINWIERTGTLNNIYMVDVIFTNLFTGFIAGQEYGNAVIFKSTNNGINWNQQLYVQGSTNRCNQIYLINDLTGWACCFGGIYKTTNGGNPIGIQYFSNGIPSDFSLSQNYPNPFNPQTKIKFDVPANVKGQTSNVKLIIYDLLGREVATLVNEELKPCTYEADWDGSGYSSGVYFYKLVAGDFTETKKMLMVK